MSEKSKELAGIAGNLAKGAAKGALGGLGKMTEGIGHAAEGAGSLMKKASEDIDLGKVADSARSIVTVENGIKVGSTASGAFAGAVVGSIGLTGLGFALGGPAGAAAGYALGKVIGGGAGALAEFKGGSALTSAMGVEKSGEKESWRRDHAIDVDYREDNNEQKE